MSRDYIVSEVETLVSGYGVLEAPLWDRSGGLYFADVRFGGIYHVNPSGKVECLHADRVTGGLLHHADGGLVVTGSSLARLHKGCLKDIAKPSPGGWSMFNDLDADTDGNVLVGLLRWRPHKNEMPVPGEIWRVEAGGSQVKVLSDIESPNGVGILDHGIVVTDTTQQVLVEYSYNEGEESSITKHDMQDVGYPDGLAIDEEGGIWVAAFNSGSVVRLVDGVIERTVNIPAQRVTSVCFGGADMRQLFVTSSDNTEQPDLGGCVFRTEVGVKGKQINDARI